MISHANIVAGAAGLLDRTAGAHFTFESGPNETYCAYLPLAHIMEMICETGLYALGARVGFGSPHTLTPAGVKLKTGTCEGDAAALGPTMMVFAPAVLDKVYADPPLPPTPTPIPYPLPLPLSPTPAPTPTPTPTPNPYPYP